LATLSPVAILGMGALCALAALAAATSWRRLRVDHVLLASSFIALAFLARRNVALIGFGVLPLIASGFAPIAERADAWLGRHRPLRVALDLSLAVLFAIPIVRIVAGTWYPNEAHLTRTFGLGRSDLLFSRGATDWIERHAPSAVLFDDDVL